MAQANPSSSRDLSAQEYVESQRLLPAPDESHEPAMQLREIKDLPKINTKAANSQTPRTPKSARSVHFDLPPLTPSPSRNSANGHPPPYTHFPSDSDEDFLDDGIDGGEGHGRVPLLDAPAALEPWETGNDIHSWAERERRRPKSNLRSAFMNMANSIIGAGIIGQPYAFRQAGLLSGIILLVGLTVVVDWTIRLIVVNSKLSGKPTFQGTVEHCYGKWGLVAVSLAQWFFAFGGMVAFCVIVGDSIPPVMETIWPGLRAMPVWGSLASRRAVIVLFVGSVSWPLSLYRDISKLAQASTLALISMVVILITVITQGIVVPLDFKGVLDTPLLTVNTGIFQAIGVISFAFVCHHNTLLIYSSLHTPTLDRFETVVHHSTFISLVACLSMALAGFLTFADKTQGNVLNNFPADNTMVNIARFCFGLNMLTTLPLEAFVCREVMVNYFWNEDPAGGLEAERDEDGSKTRSTDFWRHLLLSTGLVWAAVAFSLVTCDLGAVFELIGATSACMLAYILPTLCFIRLSKRSWKTTVAWAVVGFGVVVLCISVVMAVVKVFRGGSSETASCNW